MRKQSRTLIACLALPIFLAACAHRNSDLPPAPTPDQLSSAKAVEQATAVDVTQRCRKLAKQVPAPQDYPGKDVYASRKEYEAALDLADGRLRATDACIAALAKAYAKGLPTK